MLGPPVQQRAIKVLGSAALVCDEQAPVPQLGPDEILVRVVAVAINPFDGKSADLSPSKGATLGCDFAGDVVKVGTEEKTSLVIGDRVCGCVFGNNPDERNNGAFAQFLVTVPDLVYRIPDHMSYQAASTLTVGMLTVGLALYHTLKLPLPARGVAFGNSHILIYGAGTATGTIAIQLAKLSGLRPIAICSPHTFQRVKDLGAVAAFDYRSATCGEDVRTYTRDELVYCLDCITNQSTMKICYDALSSHGGHWVGVDAIAIRGHTRRSVKAAWVMSLTVFGKAVHWPRPFLRDAKPKDKSFAQHWLRYSQQLLDNEVVQCHPYEEFDGGFDTLIAGVHDVRLGRVVGKKLVYTVG